MLILVAAKRTLDSHQVTPQPKIQAKITFDSCHLTNKKNMFFGYCVVDTSAFFATTSNMVILCKKDVLNL